MIFCQRAVGSIARAAISSQSSTVGGRKPLFFRDLLFKTKRVRQDCGTCRAENTRCARGAAPGSWLARRRGVSIAAARCATWNERRTQRRTGWQRAGVDKRAHTHTLARAHARARTHTHARMRARARARARIEHNTNNIRRRAHRQPCRAECLVLASHASLSLAAHVRKKQQQQQPPSPPQANEAMDTPGLSIARLQSGAAACPCPSLARTS